MSSSITISIWFNDYEKRISVDEAKKIYEQLDKIFGNQKEVVTIPYPEPISPGPTPMTPYCDITMKQ